MITHTPCLAVTRKATIKEKKVFFYIPFGSKELYSKLHMRSLMQQATILEKTRSYEHMCLALSPRYH